MQFVHINNGLGAGNIGDEIMAEVFWRLLPPEISLEVPLYAESQRFRGTYPAHYSYALLTDPLPGHPLSGYPRKPVLPGLLVGDTPVSDFEGSPFPLNIVGPTLSHFHQQGLPVDAIAVGVDPLTSPDSIALFKKHYSHIRSWSVRSQSCKQALLALGVPEANILVAADLAWLFEPATDCSNWAAQQWANLGLNADDQLLTVNVTSHGQGQSDAPMHALAEALDRLQQQHNLRIAFLSNETRRGQGYDEAAANRLRALMRTPSILVPHEYYSPAEMVALLRRATVVLSHRYHMSLQSILAGTVPIAIPRGPKLSGLIDECGIPATAAWDELQPDALVTTILATIEQRHTLLPKLSETVTTMRTRASHALDLARTHWQSAEAISPTPNQDRPQPSSIVVSHLGGMGDVVLLSALVEKLRHLHPQAKITVCVRQQWLPLLAHFPVAPDHQIGLDFDPTSWTRWSTQEDQILRQFVGQLPPCDLFIAADYSPNWFS